MLSPDNLFAKINLNNLTSQRLKYIRSLGLNMELCVTDSTYLFKKFDSLYVSINDTMIETGVRAIMHLPFYGLQLGCSDYYIRSLSKSLILKGIKRSLELGIIRGVMHVALPQNIPITGRKRWTDTFCTTMEDIIMLCEQEGFNLFLENTWEQNLQEMEDIFIRLDSSKIAMCLDIAHIYCFSGHTFSDWWSNFEPYIKHIHLSDNNFDQDSHLPLGEGQIDYENILSRTIDKGDSQTASNHELAITYTLENDIEDIPKSLNYLESTGLLAQQTSYCLL